MDASRLSAPPDAFGRAAQDYELGRPDWPDELVDKIGVPPDAEVLDLGAGTGKLTRLLVPRFARVVAVEPDDAMRTMLEGVVPEAESLRGSAEAIPLADDSVDAVFCGEAFHWFASRDVVAEIARVLRAGGVFAFLWTIEFDLEPAWPDEAERLLDPAFTRGGAPGIRKVLSGEWRDAFTGSRFGELAHAQVETAYEHDREQAIARILSVSSIASLPDAEREELRDALREIVPDVRYRSHVRTDAYWTTLAP